MRALRPLLAAIAGALLLLPATPAAANEPTSASVTITGGALAITVPAAAGNLGSRANSVNGGSISGPLGEVQVNDARSAAAGSGWIAAAQLRIVLSALAFLGPGTRPA